MCKIMQNHFEIRGVAIAEALLGRQTGNSLEPTYRATISCTQSATLSLTILKQHNMTRRKVVYADVLILLTCKGRPPRSRSVQLHKYVIT